MSLSETAGEAGDSSVDRFLKRPILNSPYRCPSRHWELDTAGRPTPKIVGGSRPASFLPPMPEPKAPGGELSLALDEDRGPSAQGQQHLASVIDEVRDRVDAWRRIPNAIDWRVSP